VENTGHQKTRKREISL